MASYLLSITSPNPQAAMHRVTVPPSYVVDWIAGEASQDGLEHWLIELQMACSVADWLKGTSYDDMWDYLESALVTADPRPRGTVTIKSRVDPHRIAATFNYLGDQQLRRAKEDLKAKIGTVIDAKSKRIRADVTLTVH